MKKIFFSLLSILVISTFLYPQKNTGIARGDTSEKRFEVKIAGGGSKLAFGDLNSGLSGWSQVWRDIYESAGYGMSGGYEPLDYGTDYSITVYSRIFSVLSFGVGVGYLTTTQKSNLSITGESEAATFSWNPIVSAFPVFVSIRFTPIKSKIFRSHIELGAQYIFAKYADVQTISYLGDITEEYNLNGKGLGFFGGVGLEFTLVGSIGLIIESYYRFAKIPSLRGTLESSWNSLVELTEGTLWSLSVSESEGSTYNVLILSEEMPSGTDIVGSRKTELDLSGFSLKAGLCWHF